MSKPDAVDLEKIGRELAEEFTEEGTDETENLVLSAFSIESYLGFSPGRLDAERLVKLLDHCGFEIVRLPRD